MIEFQWQCEFIECNLISLLMIESILKGEKKRMRMQMSLQKTVLVFPEI